MASRAPAVAGAVETELRSAVLAAARALEADPAAVRDLLKPVASELGPHLREAGLLDLTSLERLAELAAQAADGLDALLGEGGVR